MPLPEERLTSILSKSPPTCVHARPCVIPTKLFLSIVESLNLSAPRNLTIDFESNIKGFLLLDLFLSKLNTNFLKSLSKSCSRDLTPDSLV